MSAISDVSSENYDSFDSILSDPIQEQDSSIASDLPILTDFSSEAENVFRQSARDFSKKNVALMIYAKHDHNGALRVSGPKVHELQLLAEHFQLIKQIMD